MSRPFLLLLLLASSGIGCEAKPPPPAPAAPLPPVRSAMWSMASKTNRMVEQLPKAALDPAALAEVKAIVDDVAKIAAGLEVDPQSKKHPLVKDGLAEFRRSITAAQAGLAKDPPDLASATALGVSCQNCHGQGKSAPPFTW